MRIRATQLLQIEQFPDQQSWIGKLVGPVNDFMKQAITIINSGIVFSDNFIGKDYVYDFVYQSDTLSFPLSYEWTLAAKPIAAIVVSATEDNSPVIVSIAWQYTTQGAIQLVRAVRFTATPAVDTLKAGSRYKIRLRVTP